MDGSANVPRIEPIRHVDAGLSAILSKTLHGPDGRSLNIFRTLGHHPPLLRRFNSLGGLFLARGLLKERERELVILRVAARTRSSYEFAQHAVMAKRCGLSDHEVAMVHALGQAENWPSPDRALIEFTDQLVREHDVDGSAWEAVARDHTTQELLELVMLIGYYVMVAGLANSVRLEIEQGIQRY